MDQAIAPAKPLTEQDSREIWTESEKAFALAVYGETGSASFASKQTSIPISTITGWVNSEWGQDYIEALRQSLRARCGWMYVEIAQMGLAACKARMLEGDPHLDKHGDVHYLPVKALDSMKIAAIATDKHAMITGAMDSGRNVDKGLAKIAAELMAHIDTKLQPTQSTNPINGLDASNLMG